MKKNKSHLSLKSTIIKNLFISFEGIDGAGKTTQIKLFKSYLKELTGNDIIITREPGGTLLAEELRRILLGNQDYKKDPYIELLLICASRRNHITEVILPALANNHIVISDRFTDSTLAYQGYGGDLSLDTINTIIKESSCTIEPNITFYLDVNLETSSNRIAADKDYFESKGALFLKKVRQGYLYLAEKNPERICIINANTSINNVFNQIKDAFHAKMAAMV